MVLDIMMCRAQGYRIVMAGVYVDVHTFLKEKNNKSIFNGCVGVGYTLKLCGQHSFVENSLCVTF